MYPSLKLLQLSFLEGLARLGRRSAACRRRRAQRVRLKLESLEERQLLNTTPVGGGGGGAVGPPDLDPIHTEYVSLGGANGLLGAAVTGELTVPDYSGQYEDFQHGSIYWSMKTGAHEIHGAVRDRWLQMGGTQSSLGYPTSDQEDGPSGGHDQSFSGGELCLTPDGHLFLVNGAVESYWDWQHREAGPLGYPTSDTAAGPIDPHLGIAGLVENFQHGSVYWLQGKGAHAVQGAIRDKWLEMGGAAGILGYPISEQGGALNGGLCQHFTGGSIYQTPGGKVFEVDGGVEAAWKGQGWEQGPLGYPTQDTYWTPNGRGRYCYFDGGGIYALGIANTPGATLNGYVISGDFLQRYKDMGWENSALGFPIANVYTDPNTGAQSQVFENGIMISDAHGWFELDGPIYHEWQQTNSRFGLPTDEGSTPDGRGRYVHFENDASIYWTQDTGAHLVNGAVRDFWSGQGWERSPLGYPISDPQILNNNPDRYRIQFEHGVIQYEGSDAETEPADLLWAYQMNGSSTICFGWHFRYGQDKYIVDYGIRDPQTDQPLTANQHDADGGSGGSFDMSGAQANTLYYFSVEGGNSAGLLAGYNYTGWVTPIEITLNQVAQPQPAGTSPSQPMSAGPLLVFPSPPDTDPKFVVAGQGFQVTWTDWNIGGAATGNYTDTVAIFDPSNPVDLNDVSTALWHGSVDVASLAPGQQVDLSVDAPALVAAGTYIVEVVQDSGAVVNEVTRAYNRGLISPLTVTAPVGGRLPPGLPLPSLVLPQSDSPGPSADASGAGTAGQVPDMVVPPSIIRLHGRSHHARHHGRQHK
jgi:uncharacterized protein with LGFP repeats